MPRKSPDSKGFHGIMKTAPKSACNTHQGLTRSTGLIREGLAVNATRECAQAECSVPPARRNGMCDSHYRKWLRSTPKDDRQPPTVDDRFRAYVVKTPGCWGWSGLINSQGYAMISIHSVWKMAHRYIFEHINGELPLSVQVDHRCHNRACVNPDHLRRASNKQNQENREGAQANNATSGIRGVSWNKRRGKWHAYVNHHGKRIHIGFYEDLEEASMAASTKRQELFTHTQEIE